VYWINYEGTEQKMFVIDGDQGRKEMNSYTTHPWLFKTENDSFVALYIPNSILSQHFIYINEDISRLSVTTKISEIDKCTQIPKCNFRYQKLVICDFIVYVEEKLSSSVELIIALKDDLQFIRENIPIPAQKVLDGKLVETDKGAILYINSTIDIYENMGPGVYNKIAGRGLCFHQSEKWLEEHGNDGKKK